MIIVNWRWWDSLVTFALYSLIFLFLYSAGFVFLMINLYAYAQDGLSPRMPPVHPTPWDQAIYHYSKKDYRLAEQFFSQVPPSDERYSLALRYIGYNIYLRHLNKPLLAIPYVNRSWLADPFDLTSWIDLCTAYHRVLRSAFHEIGKQMYLLCSNCALEGETT